MNNQIPLARDIAASVSERLVRVVNELLCEHSQGKPKDIDKYAMVNDLLIKFSTIAESAMQQEENSKEGMQFLHDISVDVDTAMESIDPLLDEFYDSNKTTFAEFNDRVEAFISMSKSAMSESDFKSFLILFGNIEQGRKSLDYIPYSDCGWSDTELDMCDSILEVLDMYFVEIMSKRDDLLGVDHNIH